MVSFDSTDVVIYATESDGRIRRLIIPSGSIECPINASGTVEFGLESSGLFADHNVRVTIDRTGEPLFASVE